MITFTWYGTWLHGREPLSVHRDQNLPGDPYVPASSAREAAERGRLAQPPYELDRARREVVLASIVDLCERRGWLLLAAHVRSNHVHVVVQCIETPETAMNELKVCASRKLNEAGLDTPRRRRWTRHGSTRYLWRPENVEAAVDYVIVQQGERMALFDGSGG